MTGETVAMNEWVADLLTHFDFLNQHNVPTGARIFVYGLLGLHALAFAYWVLAALFSAPKPKHAKRA